jgi:hypothetical protein
MIFLHKLPEIFLILIRGELIKELTYLLLVTH